MYLDKAARTKGLVPVVHGIYGIFSFTESLGKDLLSLTVITKLVAIIFFAEKMLGSFALQKLLTFVMQKMLEFLHTICLKVISCSFEKLYPGVMNIKRMKMPVLYTAHRDTEIL